IHVDDDPLHWWKRKQEEYPLLAALPRRHLCVQATSSPSEKLFSKAGQITSHRTQLNPNKAVILSSVS
ncbi:Zinc finger BED domain-containing protein 1, partial [Arapaima gigas]